MPAFKTAVALPADPTNALEAATKQMVDGKQPLDSDLTTIAGLTATTDNMIQSVSSAWASRTPAQVKTALAIAVADVSGAAPTASPTFTGTVTAPVVIKTPQAQSVTTTLAIDASTGDSHKITATGNPAMSVPTNGVDGQTLVVEILASGAQRTVTLNGSIVLTTGQAAAYIIASGKVGILTLRFSALSGNVWICTSMTQEL